MKYRSLGKTGIRVSPYCLGAMMFGGLGNPDHDDCIRIIHKALDSGINFIDTADRYSRGESEAIVGKALKGRRDNIVLATKVHGPMGEDPNQQGNSRRWIMQAVGWRAFAPSSRQIRSSTAALNARCCPSVRPRGWARWCGARWRKACSPAATARASRCPIVCASRRSLCRWPTTATWTQSSGSFPLRRRQGCR